MLKNLFIEVYVGPARVGKVITRNHKNYLNVEYYLSNHFQLLGHWRQKQFSSVRANSHPLLLLCSPEDRFLQSKDNTHLGTCCQICFFSMHLKSSGYLGHIILCGVKLLAPRSWWRHTARTRSERAAILCEAVLTLFPILILLDSPWKVATLAVVSMLCIDPATLYIWIFKNHQHVGERCTFASLTYCRCWRTFSSTESSKVLEPFLKQSFTQKGNKQTSGASRKGLWRGKPM